MPTRKLPPHVDGDIDLGPFKLSVADIIAMVAPADINSNVVAGTAPGVKLFDDRFVVSMPVKGEGIGANHFADYTVSMSIKRTAVTEGEKTAITVASASQDARRKEKTDKETNERKRTIALVQEIEGAASGRAVDAVVNAVAMMNRISAKEREKE